MKAIILAAGQGKRLLPLTENIPKSLIELGNKTILEHILDKITKSGIEDVVIVTGFKEDLIKERVGYYYNGAKIKYISNLDYHKTNNIYSLWLVKDETDSGIVIINGDDIFNVNILKNLLSSKHPDVAVIDDTKIPDKEAMKVTINNGFVTNISKEIEPESANGDAIGLYKFSPSGAKAFFKVIDNFIKRGETSVFYLKAMQELIKKFELKHISTGGLSWDEIDTHEDLKRAQEVMLKILKEEKDGL